MAIAGSAVPATLVWLEGGKLRTGYNHSAHGSVVEDSVTRCAERLRNGERFLFHRYGHNLTDLKAILYDNLT